MRITIIACSLIILVSFTAFIIAVKTKMYGPIAHILKWVLPIPVYFVFFDCVFCSIGMFAKMFPIPAFIILAALFILVVRFIFRELKQLRKYQSDNSGFLRYELIFMAGEITVDFIVLFAMLNLLIFSMFPNQYTFGNILSDCELAFEFLYYSFNVTITYSSSSIEAMGVIAKILQMVQTTVFYFYAAGVILKLLDGNQTQ